jgi:hypothetical protein
MQIKPGTLSNTRVKTSVADTNKLKEVGLNPSQLNLTEMSDLIVASKLDQT